MKLLRGNGWVLKDEVNRTLAALATAGEEGKWTANQLAVTVRFAGEFVCTKDTPCIASNKADDAAAKKLRGQLLRHQIRRRCTSRRVYIMRCLACWDALNDIAGLGLLNGLVFGARRCSSSSV